MVLTHRLRIAEWHRIRRHPWLHELRHYWQYLRPRLRTKQRSNMQKLSMWLWRSQAP
jgi:hypothetical protein